MDKVRPKKYLGQHFLQDENIALKIIQSIPSTEKQIVEVGPGQGVLTKYLIENKDLDCRFVEVDQESVDYLIRNYPSVSDKIIAQDFLALNLSDIFDGQFTVLGNFPYNISSQIFFKVLAHRDQVNTVVGMIQKEVAERIASPKGSKKYGILSVLLQAFYDIEYLFTVSEQVFFPPPRVKSAVIRFRRNDTTQLDCDEKIFIQVVKKAFNQRRKTMRNSLKEFDIESISGLQEYLKLRPEQIDVADFVKIAAAIKPLQD